MHSSGNYADTKYKLAICAVDLICISSNSHHFLDHHLKKSIFVHGGQHNDFEWTSIQYSWLSLPLRYKMVNKLFISIVQNEIFF